MDQTDESLFAATPLIDTDRGPLEVTVRPPMRGSAAVTVIAAHPADAFCPDTAALLGRVAAVFRRRGGPALLVSPGPLAPAMKRIMPALWSFDARPWLPTLRLPALVVCGSADPIVPLAHARALHDGLAGSTFVVVDGAGHVPTTVEPPAVMAAVRRFLG